MKKFFNEFKEFISRGNVMNLAIGVIIGASFQAVVTSLTENIIAPIIGIFAGQNFDNLVLQMGDLEFKYGAFLTTLIDFLITAFVVFLMVKAMNNFKKAEPEAKPARKCPFCFSEINDEATRCHACTSQLD